MKLRFKATRALGEYHGPGLDLRDGDIAEVNETRAAQLLGDFPQNFEAGKNLVTDKAIAEAPKDKMIHGAGGRVRTK